MCNCYNILAVKNMTTWQFITICHIPHALSPCTYNPLCQVLELGKNVLYISRPCSPLVGISGGIVIPPDDGWDSGLVSLSVLNHCEGRVEELSIVFDSNVPIRVIGAIVFCLGLKVWKIQGVNGSEYVKHWRYDYVYVFNITYIG